MKYKIITYGCQMNAADSEEMARPLARRGMSQTKDLREADVVIMNTCTVREQAEHRAWSNLGRLRAWKQGKPHRILIVAGCAASRWGDSIRKKYPYIDAVSPATRIEQYPELVEKTLKERWNWESEQELGSPTSNVQSPMSSISSSSLSTLDFGLRTSDNLFGNEDTAYVTIMRGCNFACSYCIVPQVRGREVYRTLPEILNEIKAKTAQGKREVMLLGQTVNSYFWRPSYISPSPLEGEGRDEGGRQSDDTPHPNPLPQGAREKVIDFADLLRAVNALPGVERIRFMSPHPRHMKDRVIQAMAACPKVCRHVHLPVQSGSNRILSRMRRLYTREGYLEIIRKLRAAMPGILITTDIIVGYPGESPKDFEETLSLLQEMRFDGLFAFRFSPRPGTAAAQESDDVPSAVKEERLQQVLAASKVLCPMSKVL